MTRETLLANIEEDLKVGKFFYVFKYYTYENVSYGRRYKHYLGGRTMEECLQSMEMIVQSMLPAYKASRDEQTTRISAATPRFPPEHDFGDPALNTVNRRNWKARDEFEKVFHKAVALRKVFEGFVNQKDWVTAYIILQEDGSSIVKGEPPSFIHVLNPAWKG